MSKSFEKRVAKSMKKTDKWAKKNPVKATLISTGCTLGLIAVEAEWISNRVIKKQNKAKFVGDDAPKKKNFFSRFKKNKKATTETTTTASTDSATPAEQ